jgi:uncharacterized protein YhaN
MPTDPTSSHGTAESQDARDGSSHEPSRAASGAGAGSDALPTPDDVLRWGHADGRADVDPGAFEDFIVQSAARERINDDARAVQQRIERVERDIDDIQELRRDGAAAEAEMKLKAAEQQRHETRLGELETSIEAIEQEQIAKKKRGSALYATIYSLAGLFFIAGDVIMSREIVASALKLRGTAEPWIFAIGLAMLAVLMKPAYDRLVEQRYWEGNTAWFTGTIGACVVGAISTLWVLGAFRSTAFVSNTKIQRLTAELMETSDPARIGEIQAQIGTLQQSLIESPLGYWAFVLSGLLFAVAGAVCLGIGFRHLRDAYHLRWHLYRTHRRLVNEREERSQRVDALRDEVAERRVEQTRARQALTDYPPLDDLREKRDALIKRAETLLDDAADVHSRKLQALYRRAYAQGQSNEPAPPPGDGALSVTPSNGSTSRTGTEPSNADSAQRPYRALRDVIRRSR